VLTLAMQVFAFGALIRRLGTTFMLCAMPVVSIVGFVALALAPGLATLVAFGIVRRAGEYAVSKPARETLFNVLPPEQKYKAKNVIDTLVHRFGDTSSTWIFAGLKGAGMSLGAMTWLAVPVAGAWLAVAGWLGRQHRECTATSQAGPDSTLRSAGSRV
jgi:ATP:ADP antiporter, AAA family